jgi:hypothetical protein
VFEPRLRGLAAQRFRPAIDGGSGEGRSTLPALRAARGLPHSGQLNEYEISLTDGAGGRMEKGSKLLRGQGVWPATGARRPVTAAAQHRGIPVPIIIIS